MTNWSHCHHINNGDRRPVNGACPWCGRTDVPINADGKLRVHKDHRPPSVQGVPANSDAIDSGIAAGRIAKAGLTVGDTFTLRIPRETAKTEVTITGTKGDKVLVTRDGETHAVPFFHFPI